MEKDKVSVIMAVYNCEKTIARAIDSIVNQMYQNWEMIICDDCSMDHTYSIALKYREKYPTKIKVITNDSNSKLAFSLNHCLKYANGEYIARMDGDDISLPERFERQINFLKNNKDVHLVGTSMQIFDGNKVVGNRIYKRNVNKFDLVFNPCFAHATIMTYKQVYDKIGGYTVSTRTERGQDYDLWFKFFAQGFNGANLAEPLYVVTEDIATYKRKKLKYRIHSVITALKGYKLLQYPLRYYIYAFKPIFVGFIPNYIMEKIKLAMK